MGAAPAMGAPSMGAPQTPSMGMPPSRRMPRTAGARSRYVDTGFEAPSNDGGMPPPAPKPKVTFLNI
jgi:hypothetical protein